MSNSTILELRQLDSDDVSRNGFYRTNLDSTVLLEEGDQVNIKAVYLDTAESAAGLIHLENDVNVEMDMAIYIQNYDKDQSFTNKTNEVKIMRQYPNLDTPQQRTVDNMGDNAIWWLAEGSTQTAGTSWDVSSLTLSLVGGNDKDYGGVGIVVQWMPTTPNATYQFSTIKVKPKRRRKELDKYNPYPVNLICADKDGKPDILLYPPSADLTAFQIASVKFNSKLISTADTMFNLQTFPIKFTVSAGDYTPSEIAAVITDNLANIEQNKKVSSINDANMSQTTITRTNWSAESPFLTTVMKNTQTLEAQGNISNPPETIFQVFINATDYIVEILPATTPKTFKDISGEYYMTYNISEMKADFVIPGAGFKPVQDRYLGGEQISLSYDVNEGKLKFDSLHFPIYVESGELTNDGVPGLLYNSIDNTEPGKLSIPTGLPLRYSGVAFTKLFPTDFWEKTLGFDNIVISPQQTAKCSYPGFAAGDAPNGINSFVVPCENGINITGAFPGLDSGVKKNKNTYSTPPFADLTGTGSTPPFIVSTPETWGIFGSRTFNNSVADEGYFLVDVSSNIRQSLIGQNGGSNSTQSIVNRYYTQNSFTSDQGQGSIGYTHTGAPQLLSEFQVRVLNPDKSPVASTILQPKNTVFIEILKSIKEDPN